MKLSEHEIEKRERQRQEEMRRELEKVKKRRIVRIQAVVYCVNHHRKGRKRESKEKRRW